MAWQGTLAVLPLNDLSLVKSRLGPAGVDRQRLALDLLAHAVQVLGQVEEVTARWVVSPDPSVRGPAESAGGRWLRQLSRGLNPALEEARERALEFGYQRLLVVLPDLPFLDVSDILCLLEPTPKDGPVLTLAPDRWGRGTNLWLSQPVAGLPFLFGPDSFSAHQGAARRAGWSCGVVRRPGCARDLDTPQDWEEYRWSLPSSCCR